MATATETTTGSAKIAGGTVAALAGLSWIGLKVPPAAFEPVVPRPEPPETVPIPAGLPMPVRRFLRATYGSRLPVVRTAVVSGRGRLRIFGLWFPHRFRFAHEAGRNFHSYIELTVFGRPFMRVSETYFRGRFHQSGTPAGDLESTPQFEQAANIRMWAEAINWFPAILATDKRVRWEPVDDQTAVLVVPAPSGADRMIVRFDEESNKVRYFEAMRFKEPGDQQKTLWINGVWFDEGRPWARWDVEDVALNVDVHVAMEAE